MYCMIESVCEREVFPSYLETQWWLLRMFEAVERGPLRLCEVVEKDSCNISIGYYYFN